MYCDDLIFLSDHSLFHADSLISVFSSLVSECLPTQQAMPPGTVQSLSVPLSWGGEHFHTAMPAARALQVWLTELIIFLHHPCHHIKSAFPFEKLVCAQPVYDFEPDTALQQRSNGVLTDLPLVINPVNAPNPSTRKKASELKHFSATPC